MRALHFLLPLFLGGCVINRPEYAATQRDILTQSQVEIARREPWASNAAIFVDESNGFPPYTWRVRAGSLDRSGLPTFTGIHFVPGTQRELRFSSEGCLLSYIDRGNRCVTPVSTTWANAPMETEK